MNIQLIGRIVSLLAAAVTLATLHYALEFSIYVGLAAGLIVYTAGRIAFALFAAKAGPR